MPVPTPIFDALAAELAALKAAQPQPAPEPEPVPAPAPIPSGWTQIGGGFLEAASVGVTPDMGTPAGMFPYNCMAFGPDEDLLWGGGHNQFGGNGPVRWDREALRYKLMIPHAPLDPARNMRPDKGPRAGHVYSGIEYLRHKDCYVVLTTRTGWVRQGVIARDGNETWFIDWKDWSWRRGPDYPAIGNDLGFDLFVLPESMRTLRLTRAGNTTYADYLDADAVAWSAPVPVSSIYMGLGSSVSTFDAALSPIAYLIGAEAGLVRVTALDTKPVLERIGKCWGMYEGTGLCADAKEDRVYLYIGTDMVRWSRAGRGFQRWKGEAGPKAGWLGAKGRMTDDGLAIVWHMGPTQGVWRWAVDRDDSHWEDWPALSATPIKAKIDAAPAGSSVQADPVAYPDGAVITKPLDFDANGAAFNRLVSDTSAGKAYVYVKALGAVTVRGPLRNLDNRTPTSNRDATAAIRGEGNGLLLTVIGDFGLTDNGVLFGTPVRLGGNGSSVLRLLDGRIHDVGGGDFGKAHGVYCDEVAEFYAEDRDIVGVGNAGNSFKSRAQKTSFIRCRSWGNPLGNRPRDVPNGGILYVEDELCVKDMNDDDLAFYSYAREVSNPLYKRWPVNTIEARGVNIYVNRMKVQARLLDLPVPADPSYPTVVDFSMATVVLVGDILLGGQNCTAAETAALDVVRFATEAEAAAAGIVIPT